MEFVYCPCKIVGKEKIRDELVFRRAKREDEEKERTTSRPRMKFILHKVAEEEYLHHRDSGCNRDKYGNSLIYPDIQTLEISKVYIPILYMKQ